MHHLTLGLTVLTVLASAAPTHALDPLPVQVERVPWLGFQLRMGLPQGDGTDFTVFTPRIDAMIPVGGNGGIALQWATGLLVPDEGDSRFVAGNVLVGYAFNPRPDLRFTPSVVLPLARVSDDDPVDALEQVVTYAMAALATGGHDIWLYMPETFGIIAPLYTDMVVSDVVRLESSVALAILFPSEGDDVELIGDLEFAAFFSVVRVGIGAVLFLTQDGSDDAVITGTLGVRVPAGAGRLSLDLLVTLDEPALFEDGTVPSIGIGYATPL